jgi:hypothetical protein
MGFVKGQKREDSLSTSLADDMANLQLRSRASTHEIKGDAHELPGAIEEAREEEDEEDEEDEKGDLRSTTSKPELDPFEA